MDAIDTVQGLPVVSRGQGRRAVWLRRLLPAALTALLFACGGGSDDGGGGEVTGPPTTGAALAGTSAEASQSVQAALAGGDAMAARAGTLSGLSVLFGGPIGVQQAAPSAGRMHALAVETVGCSDFLAAPCSGSMSIDTSVPDEATSIRAGDFAAIQFTGLSGALLGNRVVLNGGMRLDFQTPLDLDSGRLNGVTVQVAMTAFAGSINGVAFGPVTDTGLLEIDANGVASVTAAGARYTGLRNVSFTSAGNYTVGSGSVRVAYWSDSGRYVDVTLQNWRVANGRPAVGSRATITGVQGSIAVTVTSVSATTVGYGVSIAGGGSYVVTATYPANGAPTYTVAPA